MSLNLLKINEQNR